MITSLLQLRWEMFHFNINRPPRPLTCLASLHLPQILSDHQLQTLPLSVEYHQFLPHHRLMQDLRAPQARLVDPLTPHQLLHLSHHQDPPPALQLTCSVVFRVQGPPDLHHLVGLLLQRPTGSLMGPSRDLVLNLVLNLVRLVLRHHPLHHQVSVLRHNPDHPDHHPADQLFLLVIIV